MSYPRRSRPLIPLILCGLLPAVALATEQTHRQEVTKLFSLVRMEQQVNESVDNLVALQLRQEPRLAKHTTIVRNFFERNIGWEAMRPALIDMYMSNFSEEELAKMNAFYITPVGQKLLTRAPELVQQRNELAAQRLQKRIGELEKDLEAASHQAQ